METKQNSVQEQPAPTLHQSERQSAPEQSGGLSASAPQLHSADRSEPQSGSQSAPTLDPDPYAPPLYDPAEAAQIVRILTDGYFDPEYILLFGKLVGGAPHSEATAYDLLMVVRNPSEYDWIQAKRILRYRMPYRHRKITYVNAYILPVSYVESHRTPFLWFAHAEGTLLYCSDRCRFRRPRHPADFSRAHADARHHFDTFRMQGSALIERAQEALADSCNMRLAAQFTAQAAVCFYHTLYYVYHGMEFDSHDPVVMHDRMRTLSTRLMLVFDDTHIERIFTLPRLKQALMKTPHSIRFDMPVQELEQHLARVRKAGRIIESYCERRLELYRELCE